MKRVILLTLSLLLGISSYAQTEWEIQPSTLKINASNSLDISNVSSNSVTLHNWIAESKENKKQNRITARNGILPLYVNGTSKRISFGIEDIIIIHHNINILFRPQTGKQNIRRIYIGE